MDVCAGGTINAGATTVTFENHHPESCTISGCTMPGWPTSDPVVPAQQGGHPGTLTVQLSQPAVVGDYPYTASCCKKRTGPQIKVQ